MMKGDVENTKGRLRWAATAECLALLFKTNPKSPITDSLAGASTSHTPKIQTENNSNFYQLIKKKKH